MSDHANLYQRQLGNILIKHFPSTFYIKQCMSTKVQKVQKTKLRMSLHSVLARNVNHVLGCEKSSNDKGILENFNVL